MAKNNPLERMQLLDEELRTHSWLYHVKQEPSVTNMEYDELEREFRGLCDKYPELAIQFESHLKAVPIDLPTGGPLAVIKFDEPMLSVKKIHSEEELAKFISTCPADTELVYELKLDGLALELKYIYGELKSFTTRGSGMVGEDVLHAHPLFVQGVIPLRIETDLEEVILRGEAWISIKDYNDYNDSVTEKKKDPRNAVSGWIRTHPSRIDHKILNTLQFSVYWSGETFGVDTYQKLKGVIRDFGFDTPQEVTREHLENNLRTDLIPNDGIMVKVNSLATQKAMGVGNRHPNWSVGYKFPPAEGTPQLTDVEWSTSGYGRVIPVAIFTPIKLGGVRVSRASLDNYGAFMVLGLGVGDTVSVTRNNDVIPRLNQVVRPGDNDALEAPTECPSCSSLLEVRVGKTSADLVCNNLSGCPAQLINRTVIMGDKFGLDIDGLGPVIVSDLVAREHVKQPADIFTLGPAGHALLSEVLRTNIINAKTQPLDRFIKALCLPDVGVVLSKRLAEALARDDVFEAEFDGGVAHRAFALEKYLTHIDFLTTVKGISKGIAMSIVKTFGNPGWHANFWAMCNSLVLTLPTVTHNGFKVALSGSFDQNRDVLVTFFAEHGIELTDKLTLDCKYLITGERPGKAKLLKATENSIPMLDVNDYRSVESLINYIKEQQA